MIAAHCIALSVQSLWGKGT